MQSSEFYYSILDDGVLEIDWYSGKKTTVTIPSTIDDRKVTAIGKNAFSDCNSLSGIVIPEGVTSIGDSAFSSCSALKHVYYQGSEDQFSQISIEDCNTDFTNAAIHYNCVLGDEFYYTILSNGTVEIAGYYGNVPDDFIRNNQADRIEMDLLMDLSFKMRRILTE